MNKRFAFLSILLTTLAGCGSSGGSSSAGTLVELSATPKPSSTRIVTLLADGKEFDTTENNTIKLKKAYMVITDVILETDCTTIGTSFSAMLENIFDSIIPTANAHTLSTPTSTGEPFVINIMADDNSAVSIGSLSPPAADYCGTTIKLERGDIDTNNLPSDAPPNNMDGSSIYIDLDYTLSGNVGSGTFIINASAALSERKLLFSTLMILSSSSLNDSATFTINYDTWFDGVDPVTLEAGPFDTSNPAFERLLINITASIHQL